MRLRITGGRARGRVLQGRLPPGVRPTSSRVREALFSIVGQDLAGQTVLDAFGGAGRVGREAWSRGARVTVVERDRRALRAIRRHGEALGAEWTVRRGDVLKADLPVFDGVFADPPYGTDPAEVIEVLGPKARRWLVFEAPVGTEVPHSAGELELDRVREYGDTGLFVYR